MRVLRKREISVLGDDSRICIRFIVKYKTDKDDNNSKLPTDTTKRGPVWLRFFGPRF